MSDEDHARLSEREQEELTRYLESTRNANRAAKEHQPAPLMVQLILAEQYQRGRLDMIQDLKRGQVEA